MVEIEILSQSEGADDVGNELQLKHIFAIESQLQFSAPILRWVAATAANRQALRSRSASDKASPRQRKTSPDQQDRAEGTKRSHGLSQEAE